MICIKACYVDNMENWANNSSDPFLAISLPWIFKDKIYHFAFFYVAFAGVIGIGYFIIGKLCNLKKRNVEIV